MTASERGKTLRLAAAVALVSGAIGFGLGYLIARPVPPPVAVVGHTAPGTPGLPTAAEIDAGHPAGMLKLSLPGLPSDSRLLSLDNSCYRVNLSPAVAWSGAPDGTRSFALFMVRPNADKTETLNWAVFNLPGDLGGLPAGLPHQPVFKDGTVQARNDHGAFFYVGPCEPHGTVDYVFRLYALDTVLPFKAPVDKGVLYAAMNGHVLDDASVAVIHDLHYQGAKEKPVKALSSAPAKSGTDRR